MSKDKYYTDMKDMIRRTRAGLITLSEGMQDNPNVVNDKSAELQNQVLNSDNEGVKLTLDQNKEATIVADAQTVSDNIKTTLQQKLNGYISAVGAFVTSMDKMTVNIADTSLTMTIQVMMDGGQPATLSVSTADQKMQLKYDNFLQLTDKNVNFMKASMNYFSPELWAELQGLVTIQ